MVFEIKSEWKFLQCVTWDTGDAFVGVEKMIQEIFLPLIFFGKTKNLSPILGALSMILINLDVLGLLNTLTPAKDKYLSSHWGSAEMIWV